MLYISNMDYNKILTKIYEESNSLISLGEQASYIPELKKVDPNQYGISIVTTNGKKYSLGDSQVRFSIQSISKVFSLAMGISFYGENIWKRVGVEPSGMPFNSVIQLEMEKGRPRNPLINSGALVISDMLLSVLKDPEKEYLDFVRGLCGVDTVNYNLSVAKSEFKTGYLNAAISNMLKYYGNIDSDIERLLNFYFYQCSIEMSCTELAMAFNNFANHKKSFSIGEINLTSSQVKRINAIMQTCGLYDEAGEFSYLVGLPAKSGVGGGIAAICPNHYSVAVWSPRLNKKGNSVWGMKMLELLTTLTEISVF